MDKQHLDNLRHSCAHLLASAVQELYPDAKRTIGPPIDTGFYYDFDFGDTSISDEDLKRIEKKMGEVLKSWESFSHKELSVDEAKALFKGNEYKHELIDEFAGEEKTLTAYSCGTFTDLCKGGHCEDPKKELRHFKLLSLAGAYWRGDENNTMLTRIYGTCFPTKEELKNHLTMLEEAKKRDHRKLGKELDLFTVSDLVGSGLPMFTPKGTILRNEVSGYSEYLRGRIGFERVWVPHITKKDLYETSGHWAKFGDELFLVKSQETSDEMVMKPMNCPHHTRIYASKPRSYRDMPIRYMETTTVYRDEKSGELGGLSRVRSITQDDSHAFCRRDQIEGEIERLLAAAHEMYSVFGMALRIRLSYRDDSDAYLGDADLWQSAQEQLKNAVIANKLEYFEEEGEAAFYGPKIDFMATDAIGREHQVATVQLDFVMPERFGLVYADADGTEKTPVMIHCALLGSIERFLSVYIEHTAGNFPVWLSPVQVHIIPVSTEKHLDGARAVADELRDAGMRVSIDEADETVGKKIRNAAKQKVPYMLVVGDKEVGGGDLTVRVRGQEEQESMKKDVFIDRVKKEIADRSA